MKLNGRPRTPIKNGMKHCPVCKTDKPLAGFTSYKSHNGKTYLRSYCKPCATQYVKEYRFLKQFNNDSKSKELL